MWRNEKFHTTKEQVIAIADSNKYGGFVDTDGAWCAASTPYQFKEMLEELGFEVLECRETAYSTAIATTNCGLSISWNGHCSRIW